MDVLLRTMRAVPWSKLSVAVRSRAAERFAVGGLLGVLASCGLAQFQAQWGSSGPIDRGLMVAMLLGMCCGRLAQRRISSAWGQWLVLSATISLIFPWWLDQIAGLLHFVPSDRVLSSEIMEVLGLGMAIGALWLPVSCWSAAVCSLADDASEAAGTPSDSASLVGWGGAAGVLTQILFLGPGIGAELTAIFAAALGLAAGYRSWNRSPAVSTPPFSPSADPARWEWPAVVCCAALFGCGGGLALMMRQSQLLIPQSFLIQAASGAVIVAGVAVGLWWARRITSAGQCMAWGLILLVAGLCGNSLAFGTQLRFCLWSAAFLTGATLHELALGALLVVMLGPLAIASGLFLGSAGSKRLMMGLICLVAGMGLFSELGLVLSPKMLILGLVIPFSVMAALILWQRKEGRASRWLAGGLVGCIACGLLSPMMVHEPDSARAAKLLFSTQTFLAYQRGWSMDQLLHLDDARMIETRAGRRGPITLWKSRGSDLLLREAGIPRCAISCRPEISPQLPAEVLQTVFPLLVASEYRRVLLLGSSGGIPLSTCLDFPIESVTCVEPDRQRIEMIRGTIAAERGVDPFADDRVTHDGRSIELAVAMSDGGYDIILSSPPWPSLAAAAPQFTREFYGRVSRKLAEHGVFCQRLEAVDYGPQPLQLVVQSLQSTFRHVAAVEIGVGEFLLLATNSEEGLVPADLPVRLETVSLRKVLARCGWDWSTLLTLPAWNHASLKEFAADGCRAMNTAANCRLSLLAPHEVWRWGPKLQDTQHLLTKTRTTTGGTASVAAQPASRRARYLDWLSERAVTQDVLRRLSEVAAQAKLIHDGPDTCWLDYRKALRDELQQRPRTEIRQAAMTLQTERLLHPEDERRKSYLVTLGAAGDLERRNLPVVYELQRYFEPYDPLVSLFARQEMAELFKYYGHPDPETELALRLHVLHFAPSHDCSLKNVIAAAELILDHPEAVADDQQRFDTMNGLFQTMRSRWDLRTTAEVKSVRMAMQDVDRTIVTIDRMMQAMDDLVARGGVDTSDWSERQDVVERMLIRPLRSYRAELVPLHEQGKIQAEAARNAVKQKRKK